MKNKFYIFCIAFISFSFASDNTLCFKYFPSKEGSVYELSNYNGKDKLISKVENKIVQVEKDAAKITVHVETKTINTKEEAISSGSYIAECSENKFYLDMSNMIPAEMTKAYTNAEIEMTGGMMEFPANPQPGDKLPDADMQMTILSNGLSIMNIEMHVSDRKVEGFEKVTTPAGTFDCIKFSQTTFVKTIFKSTSKSTTWMAENIGIVKTENLDDDGEVKSYTILTKLK